MKVERLVELLEHAQDAFKRDKSNHGREGAIGALAVAAVFLQQLLPERPELVVPLKKLLGSLKDLDDGGRPPLFRPKKLNHRPPKAHAERTFAAMVATAVGFLRRSGLNANEAQGQVARRLNRLGYRDKGNNVRIDAKRVSRWCAEVKPTKRNKDPSPTLFIWEMLAETRFPGKPDKAATFMLDELAKTVKP